ncbi:MAG TPA: hypothetical protein VMB20_14790 [Candidatus Acidoferrum sp.]|nr:hypothetical protein [Candidatus Acidoferrum sp.]
MDKSDDIREAVEAADSTGMVANQELLATFPADALREALPPSHGAHETIDRLKTELGKTAPNPAALEQHVSALRGVRELEAVIANWWDSPITQRIVLDLTQIGL